MSIKSKHEKRKGNNINPQKNIFKLTKEFDIYNSHENIKSSIKSKSSKKHKFNFRKVLIIYFIFSSLFIECSQRKLEEKYSYITYKIMSTSSISIYATSYSDNQPDEVYINEKKQSTIKRTYSSSEFDRVDSGIYNVKLVWSTEITNAYRMFMACYNIIEMDLSHFDSSKISIMGMMFYSASGLTSINLTNYSTEEAYDIGSMFDGCSKLTSLDLSSFKTPKVISMGYMFYRCSQLISINLSSANTYLVSNMESMFHGCSQLEYINFKKVNLQSSYFRNNIFYSVYKNLIVLTENDDWDTFSFLKVKINCNNDYSYNYYFKKEIDMDSKYITNNCGNNFYMKYNDTNNNSTYINYYNSPQGYYLDEVDSYYKPCYITCKTCDIIGNETIHNCLECNDEYRYELIISSYKNCYTFLTYKIISDVITSELLDLTKSENEINLLSSDVNIQLDNRTQLIQDVINNKLKELNITDLNNNQNNTLFLFMSTKSQNESNITINLGQCEYLLKANYSIPINDSLYILQIISENEGMKIPKVEYEVYYPLFNNNSLTKLNLSVCQNTKVEISIPVKIKDNIDKYNASSDYYNDICYKATTEYDTDISLKDRRDEFITNNMTLCEENCELINYNYENEKAICSCDIKLSISENYYLINKKEFYKYFIAIKNNANFNLFKCSNVVFKINNYGFLIISLILLLYFITLFIFWFKSFNKLKEIITKINSALKGFNGNTDKEKNIIEKKSDKKRRIQNIFRDDNNKKEEINSDYIISDIKNNNNENGMKIKNNSGDQNMNSIDVIKRKELGLMDVNDIYTKELMEQKNFELNLLDYEEAIKIDQRSYSKYYISLIKYNHPIMFSFAPYNDYNPRIIKMFLFFFSLSLYLNINALFFNDDTLHQIYEDKGKYNFSFQILQIIYSTLISMIIYILIKILAVSQNKIVDLKKEDKKNLDDNYIRKLIRFLKIKYISFFIITFIILFLFWFYITCFCGIYVNTQVHLIINSFISLIIALLLPFILYLIPGIFRIYALRKENLNRKLLYKFSIIIQNYLG